MLYAEPQTLKGVVVANRGLFQNHELHASLIPQIEIFTSQRLDYMKKVHESTQKYKTMPVPGEEDLEEAEEDEEDERRYGESYGSSHDGERRHRRRSIGDEMDDD